MTEDGQHRKDVMDVSVEIPPGPEVRWTSWTGETGALWQAVARVTAACA